MNQSINQSLELLWGIEELKPALNATATIYRPTGFRVIEPSPRLHGSGWLWYLVARGPVDSARAARTLAEAIGASRWGVLGLKDACARVWQYVAVKARHGPERLEFSWGRAFLIGQGGAPRLGMHGFNIFTIDVHILDGDPASLARIIEEQTIVPGFFGPQRFGIDRPNTHYLGLLGSEGRLGSLLTEYAYRYPGEARSEPGFYEKRYLDLARRESSLTHVRMPRLAREALQAYLFNRGLSRVWPDYRRYAEAGLVLECGGSTVRVPAVRLPFDGMEKSRSPWSRVIASVIEEEGISWSLLKGLRGPLRPLAYPVCSVKARSRGGRVRARFMLPRGGYATMLLRGAALVDWITYSMCIHPSSSSDGPGYRGGY